MTSSGGGPACAAVGHGAGGDGGTGATEAAGRGGAPGAGGASPLDAGVDVAPVDAGRIILGGAGAAGAPDGGGAGGKRAKASLGGAGGSVGGQGQPPGGGPGGGGGGASGQGGDQGQGGGGGAGGGGGRVSDPAAAVPEPGDLSIVELLINPAGTDTGREWIELVNRSPRALELGGLHIADGANDAPIDFSVAGRTTLPVGGRAVLIQSADATKNGGVALGAATFGGSFGTRVSLNNDADSIAICAGPCGAGTTIDRFSWDTSPGPAYDDHALSIDDAGHACPATTPFGDAGSFGTPGATNPPCPQ